jgi:hypothetical protein
MANPEEPNQGAPAQPSLPMVLSPKLDGSDESIGEGEPASGKAKTSRPAHLSRSYRFAVLAFSLAVAAALGSMIGALSASKLSSESAAGASASAAEANTLQAIKSQLAELSALKSSLEGANRSASGQLAKIADRLDRVERAQSEPGAKLAHIADAVDRLEKRGAAAPETTGSVAPSESAPATEKKPPDRVVQDWIVQEVHGGRALVASRYGGIFEVATGNVLPGLGRVEAIKRLDGHWVVITGRGVITSVR